MNLEKFILWSAGIYAAAYALRAQTVNLKNFSPAEFGAWFPLMNRELLLKLDRFRDFYGAPVRISPAPGAIGRPESPGSQHFPDPQINAIDVFPEGGDLQRGYDAARRAGFTGIGVYPDWEPSPGMHLDVRPDRTPENPALWSAFDDNDGGQNYVSIGQAGIIA